MACAGGLRLRPVLLSAPSSGPSGLALTADLRLPPTLFPQDGVRLVTGSPESTWSCFIGMVVSRDPVQFFPIWMTVVTAPLLEQTRLRPADVSGERCRLPDFSVWFGSWPLIRRSIFPPLSGSPSLSCFPLAQPICDSFCPDEMW